MNKVCPMMLFGKVRQDVLNSPLGDDAFDASTFGCIGVHCAAFRLVGFTKKPTCGMVQIEKVAPSWTY